ncbi:hypothetical protein DIS24_g7262 [Lasiodiplodia hormozganensis]|uniref:Uncharacterized protein n=1 Tax=Lasiodiplodia hormozganensis TaxID=869390 RepID=A0AA40CQS1_9PEZI|nr:hypothetical protein DIS24_g7262 [Lasiodiplodia hormozganensis]
MSAPEPTTTNLPPRKRLLAATPLPIWHAARTTDHAGQPAHAVWFGSNSSSPPPTATSFQIYTTTTSAAPATTTDPAAAALSAVRHLLGGSGPDELPALRTARRIDVYDAGVVPDVLACVEHQRREIRARSGPGAARIPGFAASAYEKPRGLVVLLAVGAEEEEPGKDGPVFVWFDRGGGGRRVRVPEDLEVEEGGGELALERVEVEAVRVRVWEAVEGEMRRVRVEDLDDRDEDDESAATAGEDEGEGGKKGGAAARPEHHLNISSEVDTAGDLYIIMDNIPTAAASPKHIHLNYLIYDLSGNDDLTAVARYFTSSLLHHLPSTTIVRLEFHQAPTLAASVERCHLELRARPDLRIGYLDDQSDLHSRIFPSSPRIEAAIDKHRAHTLGRGVQMSGLSVFVVALENKNEDGVLLVRANPDLGALKQLMGRNPDDEIVTVAKAVELLVGRPPGMAAVAARLAGSL